MLIVLDFASGVDVGVALSLPFSVFLRFCGRDGETVGALDHGNLRAMVSGQWSVRVEGAQASRETNGRNDKCLYSLSRRARGSDCRQRRRR